MWHVVGVPPKIGGKPPKMDENNGKAYFLMDDLEETTIFGNNHMNRQNLLAFSKLFQTTLGMICCKASRISSWTERNGETKIRPEQIRSQRWLPLCLHSFLWRCESESWNFFVASFKIPSPLSKNHQTSAHQIYHTFASSKSTSHIFSHVSNARNHNTLACKTRSRGNGHCWSGANRATKYHHRVLETLMISWIS